MGRASHALGPGGQEALGSRGPAPGPSPPLPGPVQPGPQAEGLRVPGRAVTASLASLLQASGPADLAGLISMKVLCLVAVVGCLLVPPAQANKVRGQNPSCLALAPRASREDMPGGAAGCKWREDLGCRAQCMGAALSDL